MPSHRSAFLYICILHVTVIVTLCDRQRHTLSGETPEILPSVPCCRSRSAVVEGARELMRPQTPMTDTSPWLSRDAPHPSEPYPRPPVSSRPARPLWQLRLVALTLAIVAEIALLLIALVPQSVWASHGLPNGPIPSAASPLVAGLFYVLPALTGLLSRRWQAAVVLATLPAWLDLGAFAVAAAERIGPFYLAVEPHAVSTVGTLELFAVLGALGWLARSPLFGALAALRGRSRP
jgi:hypothetical protein